MDLEAIARRYRDMPSEDIMRIAMHEVRSLRPEAIPYLRNELARRGSAPEVFEAIEIQQSGISPDEWDRVVRYLRTRDCPRCHAERSPLNGCEIERVEQFGVATRSSREVVVACVPCITELVEQANATTSMGWLNPLEWFRTRAVIRRNRERLTEAQGSAPSHALQDFVALNLAPLTLAARRAARSRD